MEEEEKSDEMEEKRKGKGNKGGKEEEPLRSSSLAVCPPKHSVFLLFRAHLLHRNSKISKAKNPPCLSGHPQFQPYFCSC